jgi:hypothetical protein
MPLGICPVLSRRRSVKRDKKGQCPRMSRDVPPQPNRIGSKRGRSYLDEAASISAAAGLRHVGTDVGFWRMARICPAESVAGGRPHCLWVGLFGYIESFARRGATIRTSLHATRSLVYLPNYTQPTWRSIWVKREKGCLCLDICAAHKRIIGILGTLERYRLRRRSDVDNSLATINVALTVANYFCAPCYQTRTAGASRSRKQIEICLSIAAG